MKIQLELKINSPEDGRRFLNFWNHLNGNDVYLKIEGGKVTNMETEQEMTLLEFVDLVEHNFNEAYKQIHP